MYHESKSGSLPWLLASFAALAPVLQPAEANIWDDVTSPAVISQGAGSIVDDMDDLVAKTAVDNDYPGIQVAVTKNGKLIYHGAFGYAKWDEKAPMKWNTRTRIGSTTKVMTTLGMMKLVEDGVVYKDDKKVTVGTAVYGGDGILRGQKYKDAYDQGVRRFHPIAGLAIGQNNRVITWYRNGNYTVGTSQDLAAYQTQQPYSMPSDQDHQTILAIARGGPDDRVYTWYRDGSYSVGTPDNLASFDEGVGFESNSKSKIIGVAADTEEAVFYAYYHDGKVTSGDSPANLKNRWDGDTRKLDKLFDGVRCDRCYDVVGVARSDNDVMTTWFSDGTAIKGNSISLGSISGPYDYTRPKIPSSIAQWVHAYEDIQVQHLLSHTSGFTRSGQYAQAEIKYPAAKGTEDYVYSNLYVLSTRPLLYKSGERESYSNHGVGLVGHLIETLTGGQDWYEYLQENIFQPAGANWIEAGGRNFVPSIDGKGHSLSNGTLVTKEYDKDPQGSGSATGALRASAVDLARVLVATDQRNNHPDVLNPGTLDTMETWPFPNAEKKFSYALGWQLKCADDNCDKGKRLYKNGRTGSSASYIFKFKDYPIAGVEIGDVTVSIVVNRNSTSSLSALADDLAVKAAEASIGIFFDLFSKELGTPPP